jgi:tetratricopeptide (TPR) repeat protein
LFQSIARIAATAAVVSVVGLGAVAYWLRGPAEPGPGGAAAAAVPSPIPTHWPYPNEQEWIVAEVVRAVAGMAYYARTGAAPDEAALAVRVKTEGDPRLAPVFVVELPGLGRPARLVPSEHILSPRMYAPVAAELLGAALPAAAPSVAPAETATFSALLHPTTDVLVTQSERVSSALAAQMTDPVAQEDAALLFAALGMREWAGQFYDTRRMLFRLAAHLAMADAVRRGGEAGPSGQIAEATLASLVFRSRDAVRRLDAWDARPKPSRAAVAWSRTLRMRNTEDWRLLSDPDRATLLERLDYLHWTNLKAGQGYALGFLDRIELEPIPDWANRMMGSPSIEAGHRFSRMGLALALQDARAMPLALGDGQDLASWAPALNEEPASGPVRAQGGRAIVQVLDSGTWAAYAQRQVLHHIHTTVQFQHRMLGLPDEARALKAGLEKSFGQLHMFPLAARLLATDRESYAAAMRPSVALLARRPDLVSGHVWDTLLHRPPFAGESFVVPPLEAWCTPLFPAGTYLEWPKRLWDDGGHLRVRGADLKRMRDDVPYYTVIIRTEVEERLGKKPTGADLKREFGPQVDYDVGVMRLVADASKDDPGEYKRLYRRIGELDPDRLDTLGSYLAGRGEDAEAAAVFEEFVARARDRVDVCANVGWLVSYHHGRGNNKRALEVAREAAEVYCGSGLLTLARLYERLGRWEDAEEHFRKESERYGRENQLLAFYIRHERAGRGSRYDAQRRRLLDKIFPSGLEPAGADPSGPPGDGVALTGTSEAAEKAGLKQGDVVVALDGYRVRTWEQYAVVLRLTDATEMKLVVWRGGQYLHMTATPLLRTFNVWAKTHNKPDVHDRKAI